MCTYWNYWNVRETLGKRKVILTTAQTGIIYILLNFSEIKRLNGLRVFYMTHDAYWQAALNPRGLSMLALLLIAHVTSTRNSSWPTGGGWMGGGPPTDCPCHFNSQLLMTNRGGWVGFPSPHCSCHFNSQLLMTNSGGDVGPPPH